MSNDQRLRTLSAEIDDLLSRVESIADSGMRANVTALLRKLLELYGGALRRVAEILGRTEEGQRILEDGLARDELLAGLLALYEIHPAGFETRVERAIENLKRALSGQGCILELVGLEEGVVRVRFRNGHACASTMAEARKAIEGAILDAAPETSMVEIEVVGSQPAAALVQLQTSPAVFGHS